VPMLSYDCIAVSVGHKNYVIRYDMFIIVHSLLVCKNGFLDFVRRLFLNKITTFRKMDLLLSSGKQEEQKP
jgi:hypothetical protein